MNKSRKQRLAMVIDTSKCFDCKACMVACKVENRVPKGFWRNWVRNDGVGDRRRTQYQPGQCMQCAEPSCVAACPVGATYPLDNGLVVIDPKMCIGCGNCVTACPYGARYRDPATHLADKCDFCRHRLARGQEPACVETCPTKARVFGDMNDPDSEVSKLAKQKKLVRIHAPQVETKPYIFYLAGTDLLDWARTPVLPGNVHMPPGFWKQG